MMAAGPERLNLDRMDEQQLIALISLVLELADYSKQPPEDVLRGLAGLIKSGVLTAWLVYDERGRLQIKIKLQSN